MGAGILLSLALSSLFKTKRHVFMLIKHLCLLSNGEMERQKFGKRGGKKRRKKSGTCCQCGQQVGGLTHTEQRAHFAMWCMLAAPLVLGNDPRYMKSETLEILTNKWLIEINQDPLAKQARKVWCCL